ncbi:Uncharacterised protein [Staphylococcus piscifermentans]|nr:Uncharacterised protein [Staphylococcus piscifermentans]
MKESMDTDSFIAIFFVCGGAGQKFVENVYNK